MGIYVKLFDQLKHDFNTERDNYLAKCKVDSIDKLPNESRKKEWHSLQSMCNIINTSHYSESNKARIFTAYLLILTPLIETSFWKETRTKNAILRISGFTDSGSELKDFNENVVNDVEKLKLFNALDNFMNRKICESQDDGTMLVWKTTANDLREKCSDAFLEKLRNELKQKIEGLEKALEKKPQQSNEGFVLFSSAKPQPVPATQGEEPSSTCKI